MKTSDMRKEYDFSKSTKNPYAASLKKPVTIRIEEETIAYFKNLASETGIPYQTLMNLFLSECAKKKRKPDIRWQ